MIRHNSGCLSCGGRGHVWVDPASRGWRKDPARARTWEHPKGGVYTFAPGEPERIMVLCECTEVAA